LTTRWSSRFGGGARRAAARTIDAANVVVLLVALAVAALSTHAEDWRPAALVALLLGVSVCAELRVLKAKSMRVSGTMPALVLAMVFLGPLPAVLIALAPIALDTLRVRLSPSKAVSNLATFAAFPLIGSLLFELIATQARLEARELSFSLLIAATFVAVILLNFVLIDLHSWLTGQGSPLERLRTVFLPLLPYQVALGLLTAGLAALYVRVGVGALVLLAALLFTFQYLLGELLASQERAEELARRTTELASLQVGVLTAMLQTLSLRDHTTARHSAAVARYARELARTAGLPDADCELVHTAGLLHDIGKFIFPDSILLADRALDERDWEIVRRHPEQGARVVRKLDGYGPVAEIILCHHERIDGRGYPRALAGEQIPLLARIISIADAYDTLTARASYRAPVTVVEAIAELERVAGTQLDGALVARFVELLARKEVAFRHANDADFEAELAFDALVSVHAAPRISISRTTPAAANGEVPRS